MTDMHVGTRECDLPGSAPISMSVLYGDQGLECSWQSPIKRPEAPKRRGKLLSPDVCYSTEWRACTKGMP